MLEAAAMGKINLKRLVVAGLAAGVVFFLTDAVADELVVGNEIRAGLQAIGKPEPQASAAMFALARAPLARREGDGFLNRRLRETPRKSAYVPVPASRALRLL